MIDVKKLLEPRYMLINEYPGFSGKKGDIFNEKELSTSQLSYKNIFDKIKWYVGRETDWNILLNIKYVKVIKYVGYYEEGAFVHVDFVTFKSQKAGEFEFGAFNLGERGMGSGHPHPLDKVIPATEKEYLDYENKRKNITL